MMPPCRLNPDFRRAWPRPAGKSQRAIYLVAGVAQQRGTSARARNLYVSDWYKAARAYVEAVGARWYILSAQHGAVLPGRVIAPYDLTLLSMSARERREWGKRAAAQLDERIALRVPVVFIAGRLYRDGLADWAADRATAPLAGMKLHQQRVWLAEQARDARDLARQLAFSLEPA